MDLLIFQIETAVFIGSLGQCSWTLCRQHITFFTLHTPWKFGPLDPLHDPPPLEFPGTLHS